MDKKEECRNKIESLATIYNRLDYDRRKLMEKVEMLNVEMRHYGNELEKERQKFKDICASTQH